MDINLVAGFLLWLFVILMLCGIPIAVATGLSSLAAITVFLPRLFGV